MPTLFVSHASADDAMASTLETWLRAKGFTDLFIDHQSIVGGDKWAEALRASAGSCRVVVCLVTSSWLASDECFAEFRAAWYMGKRMLPLILTQGAQGAAGERLAKVLAEDQGIDLSDCLTKTGGLDMSRRPEHEQRLEAGLKAGGALARIGLDPGAFAVDVQQRPAPFPGLSSFGDDDADAALFYGRSEDIAETLEVLRQMRAKPSGKVLFILGASGAGKSSLLKAGIIPRLRRETPAWLPLRAFRPGADPLLNFADAAVRTLRDFQKNVAVGELRDRLRRVWSTAERRDQELTPAGRLAIAAALADVAFALRSAAGRPAATILISVDQAEELVRSGHDSAQAICDYLRAALAGREDNPSSTEEGAWALVFTVRTDSFAELQGHPRFQRIDALGYDLRSIPTYLFDSVIEQPAGRYGVEVEPGLIREVMGDAPREDALPLLAFALQRLWRLWGASGRLTRANYESLGRLDGIIQDAAERALRGISPDEDVPLPAGEPPKRLTTLGAATFVPHLTQVNEQGEFIRCIADWQGFTPDSQEHLQNFDRWRLVVRRGIEAGGGTVEVIHEALFRKWDRLRLWLQPEKEKLEVLRSVESAAITWNRHARQNGWLDHRGRRLRHAVRLSQDAAYGDRFGSLERNYLVACRKAGRVRTAVSFTAGCLVLCLALGTGLYSEDHASTEIFVREADRQNQRAEDSDGRVRQAAAAAVRYSLAAMSTPTSLWSAALLSTCWSNQRGAVAECELRRTGLVETLVAEIQDDAHSLARWDYIGSARVWDDSTSHELESAMTGLAEFNPTGTRMVSALQYAFAPPTQILLWDAATGTRIATLASGDADTFTSGSLTVGELNSYVRDRVIFYASGHLKEAAASAPVSLQRDSSPRLHFVSWSPDGRLLAVEKSGGILIYETESGNLRAEIDKAAPEQRLKILTYLAGRARPMAFSPNGKVVLTASPNGEARVWDTSTFGLVAKFEGHTEGVLQANFSPRGRFAITTAGDGVTRIWDVAERKARWTFEPVDMRPIRIHFSPDETTFVAEPGSKIPVTKNSDMLGSAKSEGAPAPRVQTAIATLRLIDTATSRVIAEFGRPEGIGDGIVAYSSNGLLLAIARDRLLLLNTRTGAQDVRLRTGGWIGVRIQSLKDAPGSSGLSPSGLGALITDVTEGGPAKLAGLKAGDVIVSFDGKTVDDSNQLVSLVLERGADREVGLTFVRNGREEKTIAKLGSSPLEISSLSFNANGTRVAVVRNGAPIVFDTRTGEPIDLIEQTGSKLQTLVYSPSGTRFVAITTDGVAQLWNSATGGRLSVFRAQTGKIRSARFNLDESRFLTVSSDGTTRLWAPREFGRLRGTSLRHWMCAEGGRGTANRYVFTTEERDADHRLKGRPAAICRWQGLDTAAGWWQLWARWRYLLTGVDSFARAGPAAVSRH